jgi:DNA-binding TFAR19-related protein (PDSD5 family)
MDLPDNHTIKIFEERRSYLINKNQKENGKNGYVIAEIEAIDKTINFIKLVKNNFPDDILQQLIRENKLKNNVLEKIDENDGNKILHSYERNITNNTKLEISFVEYEEEKHIILVLKKYKKNLLKWAYQGKIRTTVKILEEIIKKSHEYRACPKTN